MPRRGMNIYKRKDGRWEGRMKKEDSREGRREYTSFYGHTYGEVKKRMESARLESARTEGAGAEPAGSRTCGKCTLREAAEGWLKEREPYLKKTTCTTYRQMVDKYILPILGERQLSSIDEAALESFLAGIRSEAELSVGYQRTLCAVVIRAMKYMKRRHHFEIRIPENILPAVRQGERTLPSEGELGVLEKYLTEHAKDSTSLGILTALYTGLRIGEVCALTWGDIDLREGVIHVRKNLQRVRAGESGGGKNQTEILIQDPKTGSSRRMIPIPPVLQGLLKAQEQEGGSYLVKGKKKPWTEPRTLQYRFDGILKECGLEKFNFHMLRHAFATRCITGGFDVKSVSEILGHSSVQVTLNLYVHSSMQHKRQLMSRFEEGIYSCEQ